MTDLKNFISIIQPDNQKAHLFFKEGGDSQLVLAKIKQDLVTVSTKIIELSQRYSIQTNADRHNTSHHVESHFAYEAIFHRIGDLSVTYPYLSSYLIEQRQLASDQQALNAQTYEKKVKRVFSLIGLSQTAEGNQSVVKWLESQDWLDVTGEIATINKPLIKSQDVSSSENQEISR